MAGLVVGIFVGGAGRRMGGVAKGLLPVPGERRSILARTVALAETLGGEVVLVGDAHAYEPCACEALADAAPVSGPLGGLVSLLVRAGEGPAIALACDMPFVTAALLRRLATHGSVAPVVAPRTGELWEPLFARYHAPRVLPAARARLARGALSLQPLLEELGAEPMALAPEDARALRDWDHPEDL